METAQFGAFVSQDAYSGGFRDRCQAIGYVRLSPRHAIVVITENAECSHATQRQVREHPFSVGKDAWIVTREVTRIDDDFGIERLDLFEGVHQISVVNLRADVKIAEVNQPASVPMVGQ